MMAKVFKTGRSQAVRLPLEFRFDVSEVFIRRAPGGEVVLSVKPEKKPWKSIFAGLDAVGESGDFLMARDKSAPTERDF